MKKKCPSNSPVLVSEQDLYNLQKAIEDLTLKNQQLRCQIESLSKGKTGIKTAGPLKAKTNCNG